MGERQEFNGRKRIIASTIAYFDHSNITLLGQLSEQIIESKINKYNTKINIHSMDGNYGSHRFSNNSILQSFSHFHSKDAPITFVWFLEKYFLWGEDQCERNSLSFQPLTTPWIGVLHVPPLTPKWAGNQFAALFQAMD